MIRTKQQKGSMMIEVVAVVALLALLTPLLFRQIQRRTEEVDNVRIATLMREAKDALGRAMEDNLSVIDDHYNGHNNDECQRWSTIVADNDRDPRNYASVSNFDDHGDLNFYVCHHVINLPGGDHKHVYHGIVFDVVDQDLPFLAAADIATMIGTEGGVCTDNNNTVTGVRSVWRMTDNVFPCNGNPLVAALSSMVGLSPDGGITNLSINDFISPGGSVQTNIGYFGVDSNGDGGWVHADTGLTVGTNCITPQWDPNADYDANCQPIFEVADSYDYDGDGVDDGPAVVLGQNTKLIFENTHGDTYKGLVDAESATAIPADANITRIRTSGSMYEPGDESSVAYSIDPTGESVMKDIRLPSRGNALLTELLPNYILKGVKSTKDTCAGGGGAACSLYSIFGHECPAYHQRAVIIEGCTPLDTSLIHEDVLLCGSPGHVYQYCVFKGTKD